MARPAASAITREALVLPWPTKRAPLPPATSMAANTAAAREIGRVRRRRAARTTTVIPLTKRRIPSTTWMDSPTGPLATTSARQRSRRRHRGPGPRGLVMLLGRLGPRPPRGARFDGLAGEDRSAAEVVPIVADLFHHVLARAGLRRPSGR